MTRYFQYTGKPTRIRGTHGKNLRGGYDDGSGVIVVFDSAIGGYMDWIQTDIALDSGQWVEITEAEYAALRP